MIASVMRRNPAARVLRLFGIACLVAQAGVGSARAQSPGTLERQVKAAYLYKFAGYIQWPAGAQPLPDQPFVIGVVGDDDTAVELRALVRGRTVDGRPIEVRSIDDGVVPEGLHLLFLARGHTEVAERVAALTPPPAMLVVTDSPGALKHGAMINFVLADGHLRFEISLPAAERAGLSLSSRLLAVAQTVMRNP
jgi:hypothetical protein